MPLTMGEIFSLKVIYYQIPWNWHRLPKINCHKIFFQMGRIYFFIYFLTCFRFFVRSRSFWLITFSFIILHILKIQVKRNKFPFSSNVYAGLIKIFGPNRSNDICFKLFIRRKYLSFSFKNLPGSVFFSEECCRYFLNVRKAFCLLFFILNYSIGKA